MSVSAMRAQEVAKLERPETPVEPDQRATMNADILRGVRVSIEVCLGRATMSVNEIMALKQGSIVTLEAALSDHAELYLNDILVARGEVVAERAASRVTIDPCFSAIISFTLI